MERRALLTSLNITPTTHGEATMRELMSTTRKRKHLIYGGHFTFAKTAPHVVSSSATAGLRTLAKGAKADVAIADVRALPEDVDVARNLPQYCARQSALPGADTIPKGRRATMSAASASAAADVGTGRKSAGVAANLVEMDRLVRELQAQLDCERAKTARLEAQLEQHTARGDAPLSLDALEKDAWIRKRVRGYTGFYTAKAARCFIEGLPLTRAQFQACLQPSLSAVALPLQLLLGFLQHITAVLCSAHYLVIIH